MVQGNQIRIKLPEAWSDVSDKLMLDRVAMIVGGIPQAIERVEGKSGGYKYGFDPFNNWWGHVADRELVVAYRYGHGLPILPALELMLRFFLGLRDEE